MKKEFEIGRVVESIAGRDTGRMYVICACPDEKNVLVTDGKFHPCARPKKKNKKHLATKGYICGTIKGNCETDNGLDASVRTFLRTLRQDDFHKEEQ